LSNNVFLKQIAKLKTNNGSSKSINSVNSLSSNNLNQYLHTSSVNSIKSNTSSTNESSLNMPKTFLNLFKNKSNSNLSEIDKININRSTNFLGKISAGSSIMKLNAKLNDCDDESEKNVSFSQVAAVNNCNQTDLVFDELSIMLNKSSNNKVLLDDEFKENIRIIVKQSEILKKHQVDKVRLICTIWTFLFFLFMLIFFIFFIFKLHSIGTKILNDGIKNNTIAILNQTNYK
jgi:hypothetical protein